MRMYVAGEWTSAAAEDEIRSPWSGCETVDTVPRATPPTSTLRSPQRSRRSDDAAPHRTSARRS